MNEIIKVSDTSGNIRVGPWDTSGVNSQSFDFSKWIEEYGEGALVILHQRNGDDIPYEVNNVTIEDGIATWTFDEADSAIPGFGKCSLVYKVNNNVIARTLPYTTLTCYTIGESSEDVPDPWEQWFNRVMQASLDAQIAADNAELSANASEDAKDDAVAAMDQAYAFSDDSREHSWNSEAWAIGTKGGNPVPSTDPAYNNNSKYYAGQAAESNSHPPIIGDNGNWYIWQNGEYVDSGYPSSVPMLEGTRDNPIVLYDLDPGVYVLSGHRKYLSTDSGTSQGFAIAFILYYSNLVTKLCYIFSAELDGRVSIYALSASAKSGFMTILKCIDSLSSNETTSPLAAKQGKVLKELIDTVQNQVQKFDTIEGTQDNPIILRDLQSGIYFASGTFRIRPNATELNYSNVLLIVGRSSDNSTTYVNMYRTANKTNTYYIITDTSLNYYTQYYTAVNNLTTDDSSRYLSAAQGVVLKNLIDQLDQRITALGG